MSAPRCTKCKGLLPPWLAGGGATTARCPNCGHENDLATLRTPAPQNPMKSTNLYSTLESQGGATKKPLFQKTMMMGSAPAAEAQKAAGLAKTMMMSPSAPPAPPQEAKPQKRTPTLPQLGGTEVPPAAPPPAPVTPQPVSMTPPPASVTPSPASLRPPPARLTPPPMEALPQDTEADIPVEMDTPPPAPPSHKSLPSWVVPDGVEDMPSGPVMTGPATVLRAHSTKIAAAAAGLVVVVIAVVLLTRGGKPKAPVTAELKKSAPVAEEKAPAPEPTPPPIAAEPDPPAPPAPKAAPTAPRPAPPAARAAAPAPRPEVAQKPIEAPRPRPVAAAPAVPTPAPERKLVVASARHVAAANPTTERRPALPPEESQRLAKEAYARGNAQLFQGKVDDAISSFKESLKLDSRNPATLRGLGLAYVQSGNAPQAVSHFKRYLKASPTASDRAQIEKRIEQLSAR